MNDSRYKMTRDLRSDRVYRPTTQYGDNSVLMPLRRRSEFRSEDSIGRFSERTLHWDVDISSDKSLGSSCQSCLAQIPYATLIATIMCLIGVGTFCGTMYRASTLAVLMADQVFHIRLRWFEAVQMVFVIIGASMAALGIMILCFGFLTTGATRQRIFKAWRTRVGGRISCAIFMGITYILSIMWMFMLCFLVIVTFIYTIFWSLCTNPEVQTLRTCIDFKQFYFLFPDNTKPNDMEICGSQEVKLFCKDYVEKAEVMFILATVASMLIILSLVHYLMCLSANYAHIRDHEKFQELQEMQYLAEPDLAASKDRF